MKAAGIYEIIHLASGRRYVGSAIVMNRRWWVHRKELKKGNHHCRFLQRAWNKHGAEAFAFRVLEECSEVHLIEREQHHMDMTAAGLRFNTAPVAGSARGVKQSAAHRQKSRERNIRLWSDPDRRKTFGDVHKTLWANPEYRTAMVAERKARWVPERRAATGVRFSEHWADSERRATQSVKLTTRWANPIYRAKQIAARTGRKRGPYKARV